MKITRLGGSLQLKLLLSLLALGLLTVLVSVTAVLSTVRLSDEFHDVNQRATPELTAALQIDAVSSRLLADFVKFQNSSGASNREGTASAEAKNALLADLENLGDYQNDYNFYENGKTSLGEKVDAVVSLATQLITIREQGVALTQLAGVQDQLQDAIGTLRQTVEQQVDNSRRNLRDRNKEVTDTTNRIIQGGIALSGIALGLALIIALFTTRSIIRPLRQLQAGANAIAQGGLDHHIDVRSHDEVGALAAAFNNMSEKLKVSYTDLEQSKAGVERTVELRTQELTEERSRFLASINSLPLGFMLLEANGSIAMMNPSMRKILDLTDKEVGGKEGGDQIQKRLPLLDDIQRKSQDAIQKKQIILHEEAIFGNRFMRILLSPVINATSSQPEAIVALVEDITEAKVAERSKDEFFSIASHELRTPLTAIRGNTSMIKDYYKKALKDPALGGMVDDIHNSSVRLIDIVNDFLDTSRLEQGKMKFTFTEFPLEEVVEHVVYELDALSVEKKVKLIMSNDLGTLPLVYADKDRIKQVIYNLVGNAMRFVENGSVTITAKPVKDHLKVDVIDTGKGISAEGQNLLFRKFQQANNNILTRDTTRGTGLGLYISKLLLEGMNGTIVLERSEVGKGSTFSFTIPLAKTKKK